MQKILSFRFPCLLPHGGTKFAAGSGPPALPCHLCSILSLMPTPWGWVFSVGTLRAQRVEQGTDCTPRISTGVSSLPDPAGRHPSLPAPPARHWEQSAKGRVQVVRHGARAPSGASGPPPAHVARPAAPPRGAASAAAVPRSGHRGAPCSGPGRAARGAEVSAGRRPGTPTTPDPGGLDIPVGSATAGHGPRLHLSPLCRFVPSARLVVTSSRPRALPWPVGSRESHGGALGAAQVGKCQRPSWRRRSGWRR